MGLRIGACMHRDARAGTCMHAGLTRASASMLIKKSACACACWDAARCDHAGQQIAATGGVHMPVAPSLHSHSPGSKFMWP
eukprot:360508-Chlamydomonas_euryale.AAC.7